LEEILQFSYCGRHGWKTIVRRVAMKREDVRRSQPRLYADGKRQVKSQLLYCRDGTIATKPVRKEDMV
jgi:hypothetical protein